MKDIYLNVKKISGTQLNQFNQLNSPESNIYGMFYTRYYFDEKSNEEKEERTLIKKGKKFDLRKEIAIKKKELGISRDKHYYHVNNIDSSIYSAIKIENGKEIERYEVLILK